MSNRVTNSEIVQSLLGRHYRKGSNKPLVAIPTNVQQPTDIVEFAVRTLELRPDPHRLILNCCRQSSELVRKASTYLTKLRIPTRGDGANDASLVLPNGSHIVGLPGKDDTHPRFLRRLAPVDR